MSLFQCDTRFSIHLQSFIKKKTTTKRYSIYILCGQQIAVTKIMKILVYFRSESKESYFRDLIYFFNCAVENIKIN